MGVEDPEGRVEYVAAAFPSACGKTNLAMLIPPEGLKVKGYRIWTVGDDIAWMRIDTDGRLWAINPETGFFGVAPGTNSQDQPQHDEDHQPQHDLHERRADARTARSGGKAATASRRPKASDWQGRPWKPGMKDENGKPIVGAHPNSRFTAPLTQCPSHSFRTEHHHGVPISAIIFGGRRAHLAPLVYEAFDWEHGVFVGATMASERTAAQFGKLGEVRRDPMAMLPFCGYHMGDYFEHWLNMGRRMTNPPKIFHVNWFRTDENGKFLWPGYGENLRVIEWILDRCRGEADAVKTPDRLRAHARQPRPDRPGHLPRDARTSCSPSTATTGTRRPTASPASSSSSATGFPQALWDQLEALRLRLRAPISLLKPGARDPPAGRRAERGHRAREPARLRHALRVRQAAVLPQGHPGPERRGQGQGQALRRHDRHRPRERQADVPAVGDAVLQRPHARPRR